MVRVVGVDAQKELPSSVWFEDGGYDNVTAWVEFQPSKDLAGIYKVAITGFLVHLMNTV